MYRSGFFISISLSLLACSSTPYLDDYLKAVDVPDSYIYFEHSEHGLMSNEQAPLKAEFERCQQSVFSSGSYKLAEHDIRDWAVLDKVNHDYHAFLLESVMTAGGDENGAFKTLYQQTVKTSDSELSNDAFAYTEGLELSLKDLTRLVLKRNRCLSSSGWFYKRIQY
jgi:hypothetical protein